MDKYNYQKDMWTPVPMLENCDYRYSRFFIADKNYLNQQQKESNPGQETSK